MAKIILTIGIPGSGKSYWAEQFVKDNPDYVNINRDDIRIDMFCGGKEEGYAKYDFSKANERAVTDRANKLAWDAVEDGKSVVISDTNLNAFVRREWRKLADCENMLYEDKVFDTDIALCLERNAKRVSPVPEYVIHRMHTQLRGIIDG